MALTEVVALTEKPPVVGQSLSLNEVTLLHTIQICPTRGK